MSDNAEASYGHDVVDCDVVDKSSLERFRIKRSEWVNALNGDKDHAIWQSLTMMVWREVSFATIAHVADGNPGSALNNRLIGESILDGHVALQILAIRRLIDNKKGVVSLTRLLQDVRSNLKLLTRENFVCFDGLPYDYRAVRQAEWASHGFGIRWLETTGPKAYGVAELLHQHFDKLSGVNSDQRERTDRVKAELLDRIDSWLDASGAKDIATWSHAYLAHAGDQSSRQRIAQYGLTGNKIKKAVRELARVTEALSGNILYTGGRTHALMATAQFDQFEFLNQPAMPEQALEGAKKRWNEVSDSYDDALGDVREKLFDA